MKKVFITGISGLLGTNLANALLDKGYIVKAIIRNPDKYIGNKYTNLQLITMDLWGDYSTYLEDVEIVVHIAAETATNLIDFNSFDNSNYRATARLFEIATQQKVKQFIFISTANTIGYGNMKLLGAETEKIKKPFSQLYYAQSKLKAENYLINHHQSETVVTILNPTFMIGNNDSKPSSGKIILMGLGKKVVFYPPGGKNFVAVKDVVTGIINSFENGASGEKYLIAGENMSYKKFFTKLRGISGERQILIPLPKTVLILAGCLGSLLRLLKVKTSISLTNMKILCTQNYYNNQKSVNALNISYTPLEKAIKESVIYFRKTKKA